LFYKKRNSLSATCFSNIFDNNKEIRKTPLFTKVWHKWQIKDKNYFNVKLPYHNFETFLLKWISWPKIILVDKHCSNLCQEETLKRYNRRVAQTQRQCPICLQVSFVTLFLLSHNNVQYKVSYVTHLILLRVMSLLKYSISVGFVTLLQSHNNVQFIVSYVTLLHLLDVMWL